MFKWYILTIIKKFYKKVFYFLFSFFLTSAPIFGIIVIETQRMQKKMDKYQLMAIIELLTDLVNLGFYKKFTVSVNIQIAPKRQPG